MNRRIVSALAILAATAAAGQALADDITVDTAAFKSTATRAQVQAELAAYKQSGVNPWSNAYNPLRSFQSANSREAVTAEYLASRNRVAAMTGEDSGSAYLARRHGAEIGTTLAGQASRGE